jgi:uncharacterized protein
MDRQDIEKQVRAIYASFASEDPAAYRDSFADDVVWHVPGRNPVSGRYAGPEEYFGTMAQRMMPLDEWRIEPNQVWVNELDKAALVGFHLTGSRKGRRVDMDGFHLVRLNDDGRVIEGWGFSSDQEALDEFFSA